METLQLDYHISISIHQNQVRDDGMMVDKICFTNLPSHDQLSVSQLTILSVSLSTMS